jgi:BirA family biotin operon repressor/biotin-[acetyl-CoA-carboxylase] ligase
VNTPREEWHLPTRRLGRRVLVFDRLDSTNNYAAALADDPANDGLIILAEAQTAGRGQHGRSWQCPPGTGVLLSALFFPPPEVRRPVILAAWAAVSVCETIHRCTGLQATIKWPNDVLIRGRKVCGVLIEQGRATVAGIGLNVNQTEAMFAAAGLPLAASLACFTGQPLDCEAVARTLIEQMDEEYSRLCAGDSTTLEAAWKGRIGLLGQPVAVECRDGIRRGRLTDFSWSALELLLPDGAVERIRPEMVQHLEGL